jgi:hypothetical protein
VKLSRRAFLLMSISCVVAFDVRARPHASRILVIDEALRARCLINLQGRITPLIGDAVWLWQDHLQRESLIHGLTRPADAFVLTRLASDNGMHVTHQPIDAEAVLWSIERISTISLK